MIKIDFNGKKKSQTRNSAALKNCFKKIVAEMKSRKEMSVHHHPHPQPWAK